MVLPLSEVHLPTAFLLVVFQLRRCFGWRRSCWWSSRCRGASAGGVPAGGLSAAEVLRLAAFLLVVFRLRRCFGWRRSCWWSHDCGSFSAGGVPAGGPPAAEALRLAAFLLVVSALLVVLLLLAVPLLRTPPLVAPPLPLLAPAQCWPSRHAPMYWLSSKLCCPAPITTANCMG